MPQPPKPKSAFLTLFLDVLLILHLPGLLTAESKGRVKCKSTWGPKPGLVHHQAGPVFGGRLTRHFLENAVKMGERLEADFEGNFADA
jgi:hypothetical protein